MPHYDYECAQCGYTEEKLQKMSDPPMTKCLKCQQLTMKRKFGCGAGLQFQGSGFYSTDYNSAKPISSDQKTSAPSSSMPKGCGCGKSSCEA
jgi:putative FmdB family regulatory protein